MAHVEPARCLGRREPRGKRAMARVFQHSFSPGPHPSPMDAEFTTALSSFLAAIVIVTASFFQWREVRVNGELRSQRWVNVLCAVVLLYLAVLVLIFLVD
jgi:hypothetical protein